MKILKLSIKYSSKIEQSSQRIIVFQNRYLQKYKFTNVEALTDDKITIYQRMFPLLHGMK